MEYSNKKLRELANEDLIYKKPSTYYRKLLKQELKAKGWKYEEEDFGITDVNLVHQELWWHVCGIVNDLAQMVLDEREYRKKFLDELVDDLNQSIKNARVKRLE